MDQQYNQSHILYYYTTVPAIHTLLDKIDEKGNIQLQIPSWLHTNGWQEASYGIGLLRQAIRHYETTHLPRGKSKAEIPVFRTGQPRLIGPEQDLYVLSFFECGNLKQQQALRPIRIGFRYEALVDYFLFENIALIKCKYDTAAAVRNFTELLHNEYDKFDYDDEHTLFYRGAQLMSMVYTACIELKEHLYADQKEWRLVAFRDYKGPDVAYSCENIPCLRLKLPFSSICRVLTDANTAQETIDLKQKIQSKGLDIEKIDFDETGL